MKFIYQDISKLFLEKPSKKSLSEKLFQLGHEHDIQGDIFDIEITPNRGDCLSIDGIARELNIFFKRIDTFNIYEEDIDESNIKFENLSPKDCPIISFLEIETEGEIREYQPYLEEYFKKMEVNKTNLFTDISNYVSYELGQPTHCYDKNKIKDDLIFENRICNDNFKTLLDSEIELRDENCIFSSNGEIINLAGVMGGMSTSCSKDTNSILIECAYFNPESIIGKSIKYNLNSDAAYKFERGVDPCKHDLTLRRIVKIISEHVDIKSLTMKTFESKKIKSKNIEIDVDKINNILGTNISKEKYEEILLKLSFEINGTVTVPSFRSDINTQNDLAEEVARVIGYDNINSSMIKLPSVKESEETKRLNKLRSFLNNLGFNEVINFPFSQHSSELSISIDNPLDINKAYLRTDLKRSLIENLLYNERRQKDSIKLFEISEIYEFNDELNKTMKIGIIASGRVDHNFIDFSKFMNKLFLEDIFNNRSDLCFKIEEIERNNLDTKQKSPILYVESKINDIPEEFYKSYKPIKKEVKFIKYNPISDFPSSIRDFSFLITDSSKLEDVLSYFSDISGNYLKESFLFDYYKNKESREVKLGYRFIFQSNAKTLTDDDVNDSLKEILQPVLIIEGVTIPGFKL